MAKKTKSKKVKTKYESKSLKAESVESKKPEVKDKTKTSKEGIKPKKVKSTKEEKKVATNSSKSNPNQSSNDTNQEKDYAIKIKNLNKTFKFYDQKKMTVFGKLANIINPRVSPSKLKVLEDISIEIKKGEFLGLIGKNGSGKSTFLKILMGAINPDEGTEIDVNGRMIRLALGMGFDKNLSARDNVYINGTILGLSFKEIGLKFDQIIEFSGLEKFVDTPIRFFSSGMKSRLSFSIAVHADADIFLIDEFFGGVGDINFKAKSDKVFQEQIIDGKTIIFVSHAMALIKNYCQRVIVLTDDGHKLFDNPNAAVRFYRKMMDDKREVESTKLQDM